MAFPQIKKRFSLFGSPPKSSPLTTYFSSSQEIYEDDYFITQNNNRENLEKLVLAADEYRDCVSKLSKISKNFGKCLKDYSHCKGIDKPYVQCLQLTAQFYESHAEVQAKLYKALQKEFEILQKFWDKYSKKVAKDEKAHNDHIGDLDKQIKKMNDKKCKKENKYMTSLASINSDIIRVRTEYVEEVKRREKHTHSVMSQVIFRLIEGQFVSFNDSLKKCGSSIVKLKEWAPFAGQGMPSLSDLDGFLEMQTKTLLPDDSNNDESISCGRRRTYKIASISEIQRVAMNNKSSQEATSLTEEFEKIKNKRTEESLFSKLKIPTTSISEKSLDNVLSVSVKTTTTTAVTDISESTNNETLASSTPPIVTEIDSTISFTNVSNSKQKPSSIKNKPLKPNLLSSVSISVHNDDNPFFSDSRKIISPDTTITETKERKNSITKKSGEAKSIETTMIIDNQEHSINNNEKCSTKLEESYIVSLPPPPIYDKSRANSFKYNEEEIDSPIRNTFRVSFIENNCENCENEKPIDKCHSNEYNENEYHHKRSASSFETERLVRSFPTDLPERQTPSNSHQHSDSLRYYEEKCDAIRKEFENDDTYVSYESPPTHSTNSTISYRERSRQHEIQPRRAYTEYTENDNKRGPSVADIRERLLSLNSNERRLSTPSTRDPKPRQGYVNEVKSKFGSMNNSKNNDSPVTPRRTESISSYRNDIYPDQIENSEEMNSAFSSKSIINEQCNCHSCQEIKRVMTMSDTKYYNHPKDSFLPEDDLKTFGRKI